MEELCRCVRVPPSTTTTRGGAADDMDAPVDSTQPRLLLPHLRRHAVLVCGVWVVAYDPEFPVPWAAVREWILLRFALPRDGDGNNNTDTGDPQPHGPLLGSLPLQHGVLYHHELMAELPNDVAFRRWVHAMLCSMATHAHRDGERCWRLRYVSTVGDAQSTCGRVWLSAPPSSHTTPIASKKRRNSENCGRFVLPTSRTRRSWCFRGKTPHVTSNALRLVCRVSSPGIALHHHGGNPGYLGSSPSMCGPLPRMMSGGARTPPAAPSRGTVMGDLHTLPRGPVTNSPPVAAAAVPADFIASPTVCRVGEGHPACLRCALHPLQTTPP